MKEFGECAWMGSSFRELRDPLRGGRTERRRETRGSARARRAREATAGGGGRLRDPPLFSRSLTDQGRSTRRHCRRSRPARSDPRHWSPPLLTAAGGTSRGRRKKRHSLPASLPLCVCVRRAIAKRAAGYCCFNCAEERWRGRPRIKRTSGERPPTAGRLTPPLPKRWTGRRRQRKGERQREGGKVDAPRRER